MESKIKHQLGCQNHTQYATTDFSTECMMLLPVASKTHFLYKGKSECQKKQSKYIIQSSNLHKATHHFQII